MEKYKNMKVVDLIKLCRERKIKYQGKKSLIIDRLVDYDQKIQLALANAEEEDENEKDDEEDEEGKEGEDGEESEEEDTFEDVPIRANEQNNSSFNDSNESFEQTSEENKKRKRIHYSYAQDCPDFSKLADAQLQIKSEDTWIKSRFIQSLSGDKQFYVCKNRQCRKKLYVLLHDENNKVSIWRNTAEHNHEAQQRRDGINEITKHEIQILYRSGVTTAKRILQCLRDRIDLNKPKRLETDPDVPNDLYVPGLMLPSRRQISSYTQRTLKPKLHGSSKISYGELAKWVQEHALQPDDVHEPFVINHLIDLNDHVPSASIIRLSLSTKALLKNTTRTKHICADATYKLMWHGFPVLICGTTDFQRRFHPYCVSICTNQTHEDFKFIFESIKTMSESLYDSEYRPNTLIADGAHEITNGFCEAFGYSSVQDFNRIMCWSHVHRKIEEHSRVIKDSKLRNNLRNDIDQLQGLSSPALFTYALTLFLNKWSHLKKPEIDTFLEYFKTEWIQSSNCNWYEGATSNLRVPSTDNGLEGLNGSIKTNYTLRRRLSINEYLLNCCRMLRDWSLDTETEKQFKEEYRLTNETWRKAEQAWLEKPVIQRISQNSSSYVVCREEDKSLINKSLILSKFDKLSFDFDTLLEHWTKACRVDFEKSNWSKSRCSCVFNSKNFFCYHVVLVALNEKLTRIPIELSNRPIMPKAKVGRKPKATKALQIQK